MKSIEKNNIVFIKLFRDEDIKESLKKACKKHEVNSAILISGIGQLDYAKLGYFKKKGDYHPEEFYNPLEILNLSGNIIKDSNEYLLHLHITLGQEDKKTIGGHLIEGKISITGEIVILKTDIKLKRIYDEKTGLKSLSIE